MAPKREGTSISQEGALAPQCLGSRARKGVSFLSRLEELGLQVTATPGPSCQDMLPPPAPFCSWGCQACHWKGDPSQQTGPQRSWKFCTVWAPVHKTWALDCRPSETVQKFLAGEDLEERSQLSIKYPRKPWCKTARTCLNPSPYFPSGIAMKGGCNDCAGCLAHAQPGPHAH